jgi:Homing endonuclease associated repeat
MSTHKTKITAEHLITDYRELERNLGRQPSCSKYAKNCHSVTLLQTVFGRPGWRKLLKAVGAKPYPKHTRESVRSCYRRLKAELGRIPSIEEFEEKCCSTATLTRLFGGGWNKLLKSVGDYRKPKTSKRKVPTKAMMLSAFRDLRGRLGKAPSFKQYQKLSDYSTKDLSSRFGENAWRGFLTYEDNQRRARPRSISAEHLIQDFLKLQEALGRRPSISEYSFQCHTPKVLDRVFGKSGKSGWKRMISAVGAKALPKNVISASHLVKDYIESYRHLGRKPSFTEFRRLQRHTIKVLDRVFGRPGWSNLTSTAQKKILTL